MDEAASVRISVIREPGASVELIEETARSLLREINEARPNAARFSTTPAADGSKQVLQLTPELVIGVSGVASAWLVPAIQHWWKRQAPDTGLVFKSAEFEVQVKGDAPPEVFAKVTQAIAQATKG